MTPIHVKSKSSDVGILTILFKIKVLGLIVEIFLLALVNKPLQVGQQVLHRSGPILRFRILPSNRNVVDSVLFDMVHYSF